MTLGYEVVVPITLDDLDLDWRVAGTMKALGRKAIGSCQVVVVPALAVDRAAHRLGQGGGSYDRALARRHPAALVVALLHDGELWAADAVPVDPHDIDVDVAVTPSAGAVRLPSP
jgi:5-formyltetrahydrofolate cyclo-ligase